MYAVSADVDFHLLAKGVLTELVSWIQQVIYLIRLLIETPKINFFSLGPLNLRLTTPIE